MLNIRIGEPGTQSVVQAVAGAYRRAIADTLGVDSPWWDKPVEGIGLCVPVKSGDA